MTNSSFHKLLTEFDANYTYNTPFREYCNAQGIMRTNFCGEVFAMPEDQKNIRTFWKKHHKVWYKDYWEAGLSIENSPFGGWESEEQELDFL